ncbi:S8 family serine peptidase [Streptomyces panaciradicis]|uniref:S8 family serine peptidase n=1 Tax=Streptomyces panaciradicis TaxID=1470261 RepID=UPI00201D1335|nr:S8 family serine peptidase [Streptomyces panaciradicis]MCL6674445.1 S8 family serine peptidase [Streptomyces panaciradicis]
MSAPLVHRHHGALRALGTLPTVCVLALALGPVTASAARAADATAAASGTSAQGIRLPVIPGALRSGAACTKASPTAMKVTPWTHNVLDLSGAWEFSRGAGVTVAVVDTGVAPGTRGLAGRVTAAGAAADDCVGHGSFVAGLIAGAAGGGSGADFSGIAPQARILAVRGTDPLGRTDADRVAAGIRTAADARAQVIAVPLTLTSGGAALTSAVRYAAAHDCLVVAAAAPDSAPAAGAGTASASADSVRPRRYWPAAERGVLSVVDFGPDGTRPKDAPQPDDADLAAPGDKVVGAGPRGTGHFTGSGASFATAYVAGAAALVRSRDPQLTAAQAFRRLTSTAYPADVPRLDAYAALTAVPHGETRPAATVPPRPVVWSAADGRGARLIAAVVVAVALVSVLAAAAARGAVRGRRRRAVPSGTE